MSSRSLFRPTHVSKDTKSKKITRKSSQSSLQTPNIFIFPPEEDGMPPWCCHDATQEIEDDGQDVNVIYDYQNTHSHPPYFRQNDVGLILHDSEAANSETRSIVDALGDADDYSDNEPEKEHEHMDEEEDVDVLDSDMGYGRAHGQGRRYHYQRTRREMAALSAQQEDPGEDSDVIEVVKVSRRTKIELDSFGGYTDTTKSLRSRATKALRSIRGTIRSAPKSSTKSKESSKSLSKSYSVKGKTSRHSTSKLSSRPRAQDIFAPLDSTTSRERTESPELPRRPSSRLAQLFAPTLKRRASITSITSPASIESSAPSSQKFEPRHTRSVTAPALVNHQTSIDSAAPSERTSSDTRVQHPITVGGAKEAPQAQRSDSYKESAEADGENSPTWQAPLPSEDCAIRSVSPTPTFELRAISPTLTNRRTRKRFSGLNLQRIFQKSNVDLGAPSLTNPSPLTSEYSGTMSSTTIANNGSKELQLDSRDSLNRGTTNYSSSTLPVSRTSSSTVRDDSTPITSSDNNIEITTASQPELPSSNPSIKEATNLTSKLTPKPLSSLDINLNLDLNVNLDLNLNPKISIPPTRQARHPPSRNNSHNQNNVPLSRGLTLKTISSRFGLRPVKMPVSSSPTLGSEQDLDDLKMRLDSLYFDDLSFDADQFMAR